MDGSQPLIPTTVWLSLFPITFVIHFAEEYWCGGGYPAYLLRLRGVELTENRFLLGQGLGLALFVVAGMASQLLGFPEFMIVILGGMVLCNGITHSATAIWDRHYGPGLIASVLLWIPLGTASIILMYGHMSNTRFIIATLIGLSLNGFVAFMTMRGGKL